VKNFEETLVKIKKNIDYYSFITAQETGADFDDIRQEIILRMWIASPKYDENLSKENTFLIAVLKQQVANIKKENRKEKSKFIKDMISIHSIDRNDDGNKLIEVLDSISDKRQVFAETAEANSLLDIVEDKLEGLAKNVFRIMRANGYHLTEVADILKISKSHVCALVRRKIRPITKKVFKN